MVHLITFIELSEFYCSRDMESKAVFHGGMAKYEKSQSGGGITVFFLF